jgi:diacylglycerol kinase (ATP)
LTDVTPALLRLQPAKAVIFDLDDTLVQENTGKVTDAVISCMQQLTDHDIQVAILTNNFYKGYCQHIIQQLHQRQINVLVVQNAFKPMPHGIQQIRRTFGLHMHQMVLIGDGFLTDWLLAKTSGCPFIQADWFKRPFYKHPALFVLRELAVMAFDVVRFTLLGHRPQVTWLLSSGQINRRYLFLVNPKSGKTQGNSLVTAIGQLMTEHPDSSFYIHLMTRINKLDKLFATALKQGEFTHLVVAGGDGSVREALRLVADYNPDVILGIIPTGTGNLLAKALNIPLNPEDALRTVLHNHAVPLSVMQVNNTYGTLVAGMGLDAQIMASTPSAMKKRWGPLAYVISAIRAVNQKKGALFWISVDGQKSVRRFAQSVMVVQRNQFAKAFLPLDLGAENPDELDVCVLKATSWLEYLGVCWRLLFKQYKGEPQRMEHFYGKRVHIRSLPAMRVHVDGDPIPYKHVLATVKPDAVMVLVPKP